MYERIKKLAKKSKIITKIYKENFVPFSTTINEITPFNPRESKYVGKRLNLLVPSVNQEHIFGGISTAVNFFNLLASDKFKIRIIATDASPGEADLSHFPQYVYVTPEEDSDEKMQMVAFNDRYNRTLPVGKDDIFMATAWWTAYFAQRIGNWQFKTYNQKLKNLIYFIQDYEPGFYQWSSQYALADSTYKYNGPQIAVFNTALLQEFFKQQGYKFTEQYSFEPKLNSALREHLLNIKQFNKKKQILIYGRPTVPRNAFTLITEALRIWARIFPNANEWNIVSAGEQHPDVSLGEGIAIKSAGKMTLNQYAETLSNSAVGLSLMISPHPSYPPVEMAHFGMLVLTNNYANKNLTTWHENITSLDSYSPDEIAASLKDLCEKFENNNFIGTEGKSKVPFYLDDTAQFDFLKEILTVL